MRFVHALREAISHTRRVRTQFRNPSRASAAPRTRPGMRQRAKNDLTTTSQQPPRAPRPSGAYDWGIDAPATRLCSSNHHLSLFLQCPADIKKRIRKQPNNSDTSEKSCCSHWCPWEKLGRWVNTTAVHVGSACRRCMSAACRRCVSALHVGARSLTLLRREEQTGGAAARVPRMSAGRQWPCHFFRGPLPARSR